MLKHFILFFLFFCWGRVAISQAPDTSPVYQQQTKTGQSAVNSPDEAIADSSLYISENELSADSVKAWKSNEKFGYLTRLDSLLRKSNANQAKKNHRSSNRERIETISSHDGEANIAPWLEFVLWGIAGIGVLFLLFRILKSKGIFKKKDTGRNAVWVDPESENEDFPDGNRSYAVLISNAEANGNFRLAVRYHFLQLLQLLAERDLLKPARGKTNASYIKEIDTAYRQHFSALVGIYEYTWYGHIAISPERYPEIVSRFKQFNF